MAYGSFNESDLLALIEEELDPKAAEALRRRLAQEPEVQAVVERFCADRAHLRSAGEPPVPEDLLSEIEPMLARPMLMPETDWRRRRRIHRPAAAVAAAAIVTLGLLAGVWALTSGVLRPAAPGPAPESTAAAIEPRRPEPRPAQRAPAPAPAPEQPLLVAEATAAPAPEVLAPRAESPPGMLPAGFVLVVAGGDSGSVEESLDLALASLGPRTALVRNFTYAEADRLQGELIAAEAGTPQPRESAAPMAGTSTPPRVEIPGRARRERGRPAAGSAPAGEEGAPGRVLRGARDLAPTYEQQLEHSQWGAVYTISIPAGRLSELLTLLNVQQGRRTELRLPRAGAAGGAADPLLWLRDYTEIQQAVTRLRAAGDDAVILVPVVVEAKTESRPP